MERGSRPGHDLHVAILAVTVFALAFAVRLYWVLKVQSPWTAVYSDMGGYVYRADLLLAWSDGLDPRSNAFYPWGAHAFVAGEFYLFGKKSLLGIGCVHAFVGALPPFCATLLMTRLVRSLAFVALGGVAVALWQPQITYVGFFLSEVWFSGALFMAAWFFVRHLENKRGTIGAGIALAIAFCVRPQVLLTCLLLAVGLTLSASSQLRERVAVAWRSSRSVPTTAYRALVRPAFRRWFVLLLPLAIAMAGSSIRLYRLSGGRIGLISENDGVNRLFADTRIGKVEAHWMTPSGVPYGAWYAPAMKLPIRNDGDSVTFEGYIGDPEILERIRKEQVKDVPVIQRIRRAIRNVKNLAWRCFPNPEEDFNRTPWRAFLQRLFYNATLAILPLALIGIGDMRRKLAGIVVIANLVTSPIVAAIYFAEARHRVPYDPFLVMAATVGISVLAHQLLRFADYLRRPRPKKSPPRSSTMPTGTEAAE